jgi:hypothetical protein
MELEALHTTDPNAQTRAGNVRTCEAASRSASSPTAASSSFSCTPCQKVTTTKQPLPQLEATIDQQQHDGSNA